MAGYLGFLIAGGATTPGGIILMIESYYLPLLWPLEEMQTFINRISFGFFIGGLCAVIVGSILLLIGLHKYRNREEEFYYKP